MADDFKFGTLLTSDMISKFNASIQPQRMFAESIAAEQDRMMRQTQEVGEQAYQNRKRMQEAMLYYISTYIHPVFQEDFLLWNFSSI